MTSPVRGDLETSAAAGGRQYATFFVGDLFFGIEVQQVQEVLRYQEMTRVPMAQDVIEGLINLRGQIVTAVDMRRKLKLPLRPQTMTPMNVVVRAADGAVSLLVDEIGDVVQVDQGSFEKVPDNVNGDTRELVHGVYKLKDRLLLILDPAKAVEVGAGHAGEPVE
jgi:purine-binding chemotaxis protein CheW